MKIAGVRFKDNWKVYDFDATGVEIVVGDSVIVESDRGQGFGRVVRVKDAPDAEGVEVEIETPREQKRPEAREHEVEIELPLPGEVEIEAPREQERPRTREQEVEIELPLPGEEEAPVPVEGGEKPEQRRAQRSLRKLIRRANEQDLAKEEKNREGEAVAFEVCRDLIEERELPMKLIRVEYSFDGARATFFFFSENRVDFRDLVKELAYKIRTRIEMRQIGVRDVARMIGGFGPCGRELCCSSFLRNFEPVSIRMAKKQEMVLNPAKISGVCGRLLCCLSYEYQMYDDNKKDLAELRGTKVREKKDEEERRIAEERREADERRTAADRKQQEERGQREGQRKKEDVKQRQEPRKEKPQREQRAGGRPEQKAGGRPERKGGEQQRAEGVKAQQQKTGSQPQAAPSPEQPEAAQGEKGKRRKKRRFWRKKKQGEGKPPTQG